MTRSELIARLAGRYPQLVAKDTDFAVKTILDAMSDAAFAAEQIKVFEADKKNSKQMTRAEFKDRSNLGKLIEETAGLLRRQL